MEAVVFLRDGQYICTLCGEVIDITEGQRPLVMIRAASGQPNMRTIILEGKELHRCPIDPKPH